MDCGFRVHNEIGRLFDEKVYKRLVARRFGGIELEVPVIVCFRDFQSTYFLDMLVRGSALFEWKSVERLAPEHRCQLLNYLLLCDLPRGKRVNVRPEKIEHEFVNTTYRRCERQVFRIDCNEFQPLNADDLAWRDFLIDSLHDWGTGLDVHLYEAVITHACGGEDAVSRDIDIVVDGFRVGVQKTRLTSSGAAFKVTTFQQSAIAFERHIRRFLIKTTLPAVHWVNVSKHTVEFRTLTRSDSDSLAHHV
jgi:GxxExxY protein